MSEPKPAPRVFMSYSWSSPEHQATVRRLAERLRADGVDVILDQWDLKEGQDLNVFMEQMVTDAAVTKVIAVCDKQYAEKADGRRGGVGTESQIISAEVYARVDQHKFIPVFFEMDDTDPKHRKPCLPVFFRSRFAIDMSTPESAEANYEQLIRAIHDKPLFQKPALGQIPAYLLEGERVHVKTAATLQSARTAILSGRPHARVLLREYVDRFLEALEDFRITAAPGPEPFDELLLANLHRFLPYRDDWVAFVAVVADHVTDADGAELLFDFFQRVARYLKRPEGLRIWQSRFGENYQFIVYELLLYTVAVLLKKKRYDAVAVLIGREYFVADEDSGRDAFRSLSYFRAYVESLERGRKERLKLDFITVTGETLRTRATSDVVRFDEIIQADFVMFLRTIVGSATGGRWMPVTLVYSNRGTLPLFAMAASRRCFAPLATLFGLSTPDAFRGAVVAGLEAHGLKDRHRFAGAWNDIEFPTLANLEKLGTRE